MVSSGVAYNPAEWSNFFSAQTSASATLTGLLFVAVSINLPKIIATPRLPARAAKALSALAGVLLLSTLCLVPGQPNTVLGWELILGGSLIWIMITVSQRASYRHNPYMSTFQKIFHSLLAQASGIPPIIGGASLVLGHAGGLFWLVAGILISYAAALLDAWVLLIEILR